MSLLRETLRENKKVEEMDYGGDVARFEKLDASPMSLTIVQLKCWKRVFPQGDTRGFHDIKKIEYKTPLRESNHCLIFSIFKKK